MHYYRRRKGLLPALLVTSALLFILILFAVHNDHARGVNCPICLARQEFHTDTPFQPLTLIIPEEFTVTAVIAVQKPTLVRLPAALFIRGPPSHRISA